MDRTHAPGSRRRFNRRALLLAMAGAAGGALLAWPAIKAHLPGGRPEAALPDVATPYEVRPAPPGAPTLHFIAGWEGRRGELRLLAEAVDPFYKARLPAVRLVYYRYNDDVHAMIRQAAPSGPIVLAGFSYGGSKAVEVCRQFAAEGRPVDHLLLLDPVQHAGDKNFRPNVVDFVLPANVVEAVCFYREASGPPYSAPIRGTPATRYENHLCGTAHGDQVWDERPLPKLAMALKGEPMVSGVDPPPGGSPAPGSARD